jgi:putative transposase
MARRPRVVVPGVAHHVTQPGNNRQPVFFCSDDRMHYLDLLRQYAERSYVHLAAYCLMPNHIHLIAVPDTETGLARMLQSTHADYAQAWNKAEARTGHLWQGRYLSCPIERGHLALAIRYVEMNPVRAGLAAKAWEFGWSSAAARVDGVFDPLIGDPWTYLPAWNAERWKSVLAAPQDHRQYDALRRATVRGLPLGTPEFVRDLEQRSGRRLQAGRPGRPRKVLSPVAVT